MEDRQPEKRLQREAFDLVVSVYDDPLRRPDLERWRKQSIAHERAAAQAERDWHVLGNVDDGPLSRIDSLKLTVQLGLARISSSALRPVPVFGSAAALIAAVFLSNTSHLQTEPEPGAESVSLAAVTAKSPLSYRTAAKQQRAVTLDEGSEVWLDWETELVFSQTDSVRRIDLKKGKAFFRVATDPDRPFTVFSGGAVTTAIGTEFVVHLRRDRAVEVHVREGVVGVQTETEEITTRLTAADIVRVTDGRVGPVENRPITEIGTWRRGLLVFENRPLIEVLDTLEPYTSFRIDASQILNFNRPVSGTFLLDQGDEGVRIIMESYRLTGEIEGQNTLVLRSLPPRRPR